MSASCTSRHAAMPLIHVWFGGRHVLMTMKPTPSSRNRRSQKRGRKKESTDLRQERQEFRRSSRNARGWHDGRSIVGTSPCSGRVTTEGGKQIFGIARQYC